MMWYECTCGNLYTSPFELGDHIQFQSEIGEGDKHYEKLDDPIDVLRQRLRR